MSRPPNARPERVPEHLKWTRVGIECGKSIKGWLAGPVFGAEGHGTPSFKPCHSLFTRGARTCPWCAIPALSGIRYQGYLPMYDERLKRTVVCVNLDVTAQCDALALLAPIEVAKGKYPTSPLYLKSGGPWSTIKPSGSHVRSTPQDLVPWLVGVLWKAEQLQGYGDLAAPAPAQEPAPAPTPDVPTEAPEPTAKKLHDMLVERGWKKSALFFGSGKEPEPKPSRNGKHKPKG